MSTLWLLVVPLTIVGIGKGFYFPRSFALYYQEFLVSLRNTSTCNWVISTIMNLIDRIVLDVPDG